MRGELEKKNKDPAAGRSACEAESRISGRGKQGALMIQHSLVWVIVTRRVVTRSVVLDLISQKVEEGITREGICW